MLLSSSDKTIDNRLHMRYMYKHYGVGFNHKKVPKLSRQSWPRVEKKLIIKRDNK